MTRLIILRFFQTKLSVKSCIYLWYSGKSGVVERRSEEVRGHLILNTSKRPTQSTQRGRHSPRGAVEGTASEHWTVSRQKRREENKTKQKDLQGEDDDPADVSFLKLDPRCHCRCRRPSLLWWVSLTGDIGCDCEKGPDFYFHLLKWYCLLDHLLMTKNCLSRCVQEALNFSFIF